LVSCECFFFFFQAEDGIRDSSVTGVQTCALPIYISATYDSTNGHLQTITDTLGRVATFVYDGNNNLQAIRQTWAGVAHDWATFRSEERRVGKECRSRWSPYH